jgi:hypothetical protein
VAVEKQDDGAMRAGPAEPSGESRSDTLSPPERARIRAEVLLAAEIAHERQRATVGGARSRIARFLNSGIGLLLITTIATSIIVPLYQKWLDNRKKRAAASAQLMSQFLTYANTPWEEYHIIVPLEINPRIERSQYETMLSAILAVKLKRYNAYASIQAVTVTLAAETKALRTLPGSMEAFAVKVNRISDVIGSALARHYCATRNCDPGEGNDTAVSIKDIEPLIHDLGKEEDAIVKTLAAVHE